MSDQAEFLAIFRDEAKERLDNIVSILLALEKGEMADGAVDELFREAHTVKGAAGMLGLEDVRAAAREMEELLAGARESGRVPAELIEPLLRVVDSIRELVSGAGAPAETRVAEAEQDRDSAPRPDADGRSIRVPSARIDSLLDVVGETVLHRRRLEHAIAERLDRTDDELSDELALAERLAVELKDIAIGIRTLPLNTIAASFPRAVRDLAAAEGKDVELVVTGVETELDRVILEGLSDPLVHVLRNAVAHGIEARDERERAGKPPVGRIDLVAEQRGRLVEIAIADDGRGVPQEVMEEAGRVGSLTEVLTRPGFTTAAGLSDLAGRGVGLDAVRASVESFGGSIEVTSEPGSGTRIVLHLPLALALLDVLLVERGGQVYGVPLASVTEALSVPETLSLGGRPALDLHGESVAFADLADLLGAEADARREGGPAVVVAAGGRRLALACDALHGEEEVVVKDLGPLLSSLEGYLGAALLGDGRIALLLDPSWVVRASGRTRGAASSGEQPSRKVLVVEDSFTVRELQRSILEAAGYVVDTARNGREALDRVTSDEGIGLVMSDVEMPEMDGIQLTESIRGLPQRSHLPVVIVTSRGEQDDRERGIEAGADAYVVKREFDQRELLETVDRLIER